MTLGILSRQVFVSCCYQHRVFALTDEGLRGGMTDLNPGQVRCASPHAQAPRMVYFNAPYSSVRCVFRLIVAPVAPYSVL